MNERIRAGNRESRGMAARAESEVRGLHRFFEDWFNGKLPGSDDAFARFDRVLADDFHIIFPDGRIQARGGLLETVRGARGRYRDAEKPMRIWVRHHHLRWELGETALVTYEEWQEILGRTRARLSTALFRDQPDTPNGVEWLHVHEVWMPPEDGPHR